MGTFFILSTLTLDIPSRSWMLKRGWRWGNGFYQGFWPVRKPISATWRHSYWWVYRTDLLHAYSLKRVRDHRDHRYSGAELCTLHCTQMVTNWSTWTPFDPLFFFCLFCFFITANEAPESCCHHFATHVNPPADRNHFLQSAWAPWDPQRLLWWPVTQSATVEPPSMCRWPLPETGEQYCIIYTAFKKYFLLNFVLIFVCRKTIILYEIVSCYKILAKPPTRCIIIEITGS